MGQKNYHATLQSSSKFENNISNWDETEATKL